MTDIIVQIMVEVLNVFAIATNEIRQGLTSEPPIRLLYIGSTDRCAERYLKKLLGKTEIEDALKKLDRLTQEELRMAMAQLLKVAEDVSNTVKLVRDGT